MTDDQVMPTASTRNINSATERLAHWIDELQMLADDNTPECLDHLMILEMLEGLLPGLVFQNLCDMLEVCPRHICDYRICIDDQRTDCSCYADHLDTMRQLEMTTMTPENEHSGYISDERDARGWHC